MTEFRILVTGSRLWTDRIVIALGLAEAAASLLAEDESRSLVVVHGGARGADSLAAQAAPLMHMTAEAWPANWARHGRGAGPKRNQAMVDRGADLCLAFPIGPSRGTRDCMARAAKAGIPVRNYGDD